MLVNSWKKIMRQNKASQRVLATVLHTNLFRINQVANGQALLDKQEFTAACEYLGVQPEAVYPAKTLRLVYGIHPTPRASDRHRVTAQVRLDKDALERVDFVAKDEGMTRTRAANEIIRRAFETRRIESEECRP